MASGLEKTDSDIVVEEEETNQVPLLVEQRQQRPMTASEVDDVGNDGSVSDNNQDDDDDDAEEGGDEEDSAQGLPKGGLCWQSDRSVSRASSENGALSPIPSFTTGGAGSGGAGVGVPTEEEEEDTTMQVVVEVPEASSSSSSVSVSVSRQAARQVDKVPASPPPPPQQVETMKVEPGKKEKDDIVVSDNTTKPDNNRNNHKRKRTENEEDEEEQTAASCSVSSPTTSSSIAGASGGEPATPAPAPAHSRLNEYQRQLRNAREKRRSGKICDQFDHIRDTMVKAGVIVPKGTKGTILAAAKEYIALLQEQQRRVVLDNCMLVHQVQRIGEGALGASASNAVRQVAAKNGVSEIVWPNNSGSQGGGSSNQGTARNNKENQNRSGVAPATPAAPDYAGAFRKSPVAMAIATLGGSFMDCNDQFCQLTGLNKQQVTQQTIFTLINQEELTNAFDRISQWLFSIAPPQSQQGTATITQAHHEPIVLKSSVRDPTSEFNLRVCLTPVKEQETLKYLCVTLTARPPFTQQVQFPITTTNATNVTTLTTPLSLSTNNNPNTAQQQPQKADQSSDSFFAVG